MTSNYLDAHGPPRPNLTIHNEALRGPWKMLGIGAVRLSVLLAAALWPQLAASQARFGDFTLVRHIDPMTDRESSYLYTDELSPTAVRHASLSWRCSGRDQVEVLVSADDFLNSRDPVPVQWRFDREEPSARIQWPVSTNGTAAFLPPAAISYFTSSAKAANQLLVRLTDFRGVNIDLSFSMQGLTAGLGELPCGAATNTTPPAIAVEQPAWARFVGDRTTRLYYSTATDCWRLHVRGTPMFWVSETLPRREGYTRGTACR